MVRSLEFHRGRSTCHPGVVNRGHIFVLRKSLRHREQRIRVVTAKAGTLSHKVLGVVTQAELAGHARFQATRQIAVIIIRLPVAAVSGVCNQSPVSSVHMRKVLVKVERGRRSRFAFSQVGHRTHRKNLLRKVALPVHAAGTRPHARIKVIRNRTTVILVTTFHEVVFIKQGPAQLGAQDTSLEVLVDAACQSRMGLFVTVNIGGGFLGISRIAESLRIAERIAQHFANHAGVSRGSEAGIVFGTNHQVLLLAFDNVDRVHLVIRGRGILVHAVFIGAIQGAQGPSVAVGVRTVKLGIHVKSGQVVRIRGFHVAVAARAFGTAVLAEFTKELFAHVLEHFVVESAEREPEAVPEKPRCVDHHFLQGNAGRSTQAPVALGLFGNVLHRRCQALTDRAFSVMVMNFDCTQDMRVNHRKVAREPDIQVAHVRHAEPAQVVSHVACTGALVVKSAAKVFLARNTRHLAQVFRHVETHAGRIFKLIEIHLAFKSPLHLVATATDHSACSQVAHVGSRLHGNHHVEQVRKILQFHLHAIETVFFKDKHRILGIGSQFESTIGIGFTELLTRDIGNRRILDRQISFGFQNHTHNQGRGRGKYGCCKKQYENKQGA